ncbi:hypothetical protein [Nostoc sp. JL33]|uniref:hypothetical protein n=1 Tax=Nostoc sp. JL33 TaxID=2815396 RepID=UPI0025FE061A|nr:hypothetical protein [Nostoc sp. JL33]MBN3871632.1 hypothetical protein [Nostoc sp. JL33]
MADTQPDTLPIDGESSQKEENFSKISILDLQKKYGIERDSFYARTRYLRITTWKEGGKAYLDAGQLAHMDGLHDHIKSTRRMEGYPVPEPSGPIDEQQSDNTTASITVQQSQQLETSSTKPDYTAGQRQHQSSEMEAIAALVRSAQGKATGFIIAENMLTNQYIQNPDSLPEELREKIKESAQVPEIDPFAYANVLTSFARNYGAAA